MTTQTAAPPSPTTEQWPAGVTHRYLTKAAEITGDLSLAVEIRGSGINTRSQCTGCDHIEPPYMEREIHRRAQTHAEKCRSVPRPAVTQ